MAEDIFTSLSAKVEKLISMYESERAGSASLRQELEASRFSTQKAHIDHEPGGTAARARVAFRNCVKRVCQSSSGGVQHKRSRDVARRR